MTIEELYIQKFGKDRIVCVKNWSKEYALVEDLATGLMYPLAWEFFLEYCTKLEPAEINTIDYEGTDLDRIK